MGKEKTNLFLRCFNYGPSIDVFERAVAHPGLLVFQANLRVNCRRTRNNSVSDVSLFSLLSILVIKIKLTIVIVQDIRSSVSSGQYT